MKEYKKFVYKTVLFIFIFAAINFIIWQFGTKSLITSKSGLNPGDMARMSYDIKAAVFRKESSDLPKQHLKELRKIKDKIDVITIGDSFSNGGAHGKNSYYQDYIATFNNLNVFALGQYERLESLKTLILFINSGYIDKLKPKYVVLESVERECLNRYSKKIDFNDTTDINNMKEYYTDKVKHSIDGLDGISFINTGNLKFILYNILYNFSDNAFVSKIYKKKISKPLFSKNPYQLLFYKDDISGSKKTNDENIKLLNDNLNVLADKLAEKGIKLYFMPAVDKSDLYSDYIINNNFSKSTLFERLRKLHKDYYLIDTKEILSKELKKGNKDIFYPDDSHWSWKASEAIFKNVQFD